MTDPIVLSGSSLNALFRCPKQWYFENIARLPHAQSVRQVLGTATHKSAEVNFTSKITTEVDEPLDVLLDAFSTEYDSGLEWVEKPEEPIGPAKDQGVGLVKLFHRDVAPDIQPLWVEKPVQFAVNNIPISGYIDLVQRIPDNGTPVTEQKKKVRDLKTTARKPNGAAYSMQMVIYALGFRHETGQIEADTVLDFLVRYKKGRSYFPVAWGGPISDETINGFTNQLTTAYKMIEAGLFPATGIQTHQCSTCQFVPICPAWKGRKLSPEPEELPLFP